MNLSHGVISIHISYSELELLTSNWLNFNLVTTLPIRAVSVRADRFRAGVRPLASAVVALEGNAHV